MKDIKFSRGDIVIFKYDVTKEREPYQTELLYAEILDGFYRGGRSTYQYLIKIKISKSLGEKDRLITPGKRFYVRDKVLKKGLVTYIKKGEKNESV